MKENFQVIKDQISIESVAQHLLGQPVHGMYRFPGEKTPSIKIYSKTGSFYDFGRNIGGDSIRMWSHVKGCDNWTALQELSAVYGVSTDLNTADRKSIAERIEAQKAAQKEREQDEKRRQKQWVMQVDRLKAQEELYNNLLESPHIQPFSDVWCWLINLKQIVSYRLDFLCEIEN